MAKTPPVRDSEPLSAEPGVVVPAPLELAVTCVVCRAPAGAECANTVTPGKPLPGRRFHHGRTEQ